MATTFLCDRSRHDDLGRPKPDGSAWPVDRHRCLAGAIIPKDESCTVKTPAWIRLC